MPTKTRRSLSKLELKQLLQQERQKNYELRNRLWYFTEAKKRRRRERHEKLEDEKRRVAALKERLKKGCHVTDIADTGDGQICGNVTINGKTSCVIAPCSKPLKTMIEKAILLLSMVPDSGV